ncbi:Uncharacterised protein [Chromobacterium violaceum]|uniref:Uncharacterized protein n=1 Tax=Chromobacterium violaceum TaxID=536 RepID=A0A3S4IEY3_CHRVL|nr:Uncharacterised protein [Chromobacterium violaceum]
MSPPAEHSSLLLHRDENGRLVGYCTMHRFRRQIGGRTCSVLRVQSGLYKEFRGKNSNITFLMRQVMYHWLQHPLRPLYFFGVMLHPSSYAVLHRFSHRFWPAPGRTTAIRWRPRPTSCSPASTSRRCRRTALSSPTWAS